MTKKQALPPLSYLTFLDDTKAAGRKALATLSATWNQGHESQFVSASGAVSVALSGGYLDPERSVLEGLLGELQDAHGIRFHRGIESKYQGAADYPSADYIFVLGGGAVSGFFTNSLVALGPPRPCAECGKAGETERVLRGSLIIDANRASLDASFPDLINHDGDLRVVSKRFADHLSAFGATGYRLHTIIDARSGQASDEFFLLGSTTVATLPCPEHTPSDPPRCPRCGQGGAQLGELQVQGQRCRDVDLLSLHSGGLARLYFSRALFASLRDEGFDVLAAGALDKCAHNEPIKAEGAPALPPATPPPRASVSEFLAHFGNANPVVWVRRRGGSGLEGRAIPIAHRFAPPGEPAALDALEKRFPDVAFLRPLAERADGVALGEVPTRNGFCSLDAARQDPTCALRIERSSDWPRLRNEMREWAAMLEDPLVPLDGIPFATVPATSDLLVCHHGRIYYVSPLYNRGHNQIIAQNLEELCGLLVHDLASFVMGTAAVATYHDEDRNQWFPSRYA